MSGKNPHRCTLKFMFSVVVAASKRKFLRENAFHMKRDALLGRYEMLGPTYYMHVANNAVKKALQESATLSTAEKVRLYEVAELGYSLCGMVNDADNARYWAQVYLMHGTGKLRSWCSVCNSWECRKHT